tara:strand:- start:623 stop:1096 length:474 start_codon:yes stop_codon:yes gene_type:complete
MKSFKDFLNGIVEEKTGYQKFFEKTLKKYGVNSPAELNDKMKKKFFDEIEKGWTAKSESLDEAGNSMQGTILQAVGMIDNSRYIKKGSVVGNNKTKSISFKMNDGTKITINNVVYKKDKRYFCYDEILGVEDDFNRTSDIINTLEEIGLRFNTDYKK